MFGKRFVAFVIGAFLVCAGPASAAYNPSSITAPPTAPITVTYPLGNYYDVTWFGAKGNGTTNDTTALQAAINAVPSGGTLLIPGNTTGCFKITSALTTTSPITILLGGSVCQYTANTAAFSDSASNFTLDGSLGGQCVGKAQSWPGATYHAGENCVTASGTFNAGNPPTNISNVTVRNVQISNWGDYGIETLYASNVKVSGNTITNVVDSAVTVLSVQNFYIDNNIINNVTGTGMAGNNAYGIASSRLTSDSGNLISQPNSTDGIISNNVVSNIPTWDAFSVHGGARIAFAGNKAYAVLRGYDIGSSKNSGGSGTYAPIDTTITGGVIDSGVTNGSAAEGVSFEGVSSSVTATGAITGVTMRGFGTASNGINSALTVNSTSGVSITGNTILYPSPQAINIDANNAGLVISGNTIIDPWTNTVGVGQAIGILATGNNNDATISGNTIEHFDKSATYLITSSTGVGIKLTSGSGNTSILGANKTDAYTPYIDVNAVTFGTVTASGATPVAVATPLVNANSIIQLTPVAGQTGKGAFVESITAGTGFSINSLSGDTSVYNWQILQ